jgi:hypothetical protein
MIDLSDPADPSLPGNAAGESPRGLALKEREWQRVVKSMPRDTLAARDQRAEAEEEQAAKSAGEQRAEVGAVEPITALTDGAFEEKERGLCSGKDEDCSESQCCMAEGHKCYRKDENWATCSPACHKSSTWSCVELGERTPLENPGPAEAEEEQEAKGAEEQRAEVGAVEPITALTDGAFDEEEQGLCSGKDEDCSKSQCCMAEGHKCYRKDENWATCRPICHKSSTWSCVELGERTPLENPGSCSAPGEECLLTRCCTEPGMQCYSMDENAYWSSCAYECKPGVGWAENWTCDEIGERAPDPLGCSWSGEACIANKLCCHEGQSCVRKNDIEAYCTHEDVPEGWDGEVLGGARYEYAVAPVAPEEARGTSLYCFMAVLPGSYEEQLKDLAAAKGASIFACDASSVFETWQADKTEEGSWTSVINTDVFKSVWGEVKKDGQYQWHDWSVKVDPDSVFFPDRLKQHLQNLNAPKEMPIYIKNVDKEFGFYGAIEVFSKEALDKLFWDGILDKCEKEVGTHSGEDGYIKGCMDMLGAGAMEDIDILRTPSADSCDDPARVCFHAFKDAAAWEGCYNQALA